MNAQLQSPTPTLDTAVTRLIGTFPHKAKELCSDAEVNVVREQAALLTGQAHHQRIFQYVHFVLSECVPENQKRCDLRSSPFPFDQQSDYEVLLDMMLNTYAPTQTQDL